MEYKIAVVSENRVFIDQSFREAKEFLIIRVNQNGDYELSEIRRSKEQDEQEKAVELSEHDTENTKRCGRGCGDGTGCQGRTSPKLRLIEDCRCLICTKAGFKIHKYLKKKAVTVFEADCRIEEAVEKIIRYYERTDAHQSLRGIAKNGRSEEHYESQ